jgi:hypothetical protein
MRALTLAAATALLLAPGLAEACSVCFGGQDQSRTAFIVTTAFLSVLPLALVGGLAFWIRTRAKALEARQQALLVGEPWKRS